MARTDLPILEQRRIEANVIKPIYEEMRAVLGLEQAREILGSAIRNNAIAQGKAYAGDGATSLQTFRELLPQWTAGGALEIEFRVETDAELHFDVKRCRYSEMYREMGLADIGDLLSCGRDGTFCEGYDPRIRLERTRTIMSGASHCDFRYRFEADDTEADGDESRGR